MAEINLVSQLVQWFAREPLLCFAITGCICAAIYALFNLDERDGGSWISLDFDGDGDGGD